MALQRLHTDVLIIGAGGAGLRAALELHDQGVRVVVVGKRPKTDAHTVLAAGGINAALGTLDPADSWAIHAADTLKEGRFLGDPRAVELLCRLAPSAIEDLEAWGVPFAREADGRISQRYFGAHRYRRTCFVGDYTGQEIINALVGEIDRRAISVLERVYISDLLQRDGRVNGALGFHLDTGDELAIQAGAVIVAAGGHIHIYRRSSSRRRENTGDGMALAFKAGAQLADMELVQFHPSGMIWPPACEGVLVTEAVRGEGGLLFNRHGERFMSHYDDQRMELSTRDRVALANYSEIAAGRGTPHGGVWLDVSHLPANQIAERLPRMLEQFFDVGVDITCEPMEIAPTAHYSMGGVRVVADTHATSVAGLYAAGETTAGVHGANRLGGNSLAEILVFGKLVGHAAGQFVAEHPAPAIDESHLARIRQQNAFWAGRDGALQHKLIAHLQDVVWNGAGVVRNAQGLEAALGALGTIKHTAQHSPSGPGDLAAALDLQSMLLTAEATVRTALARTESRGAHQRSDYPNQSAAWDCTLVVHGQSTEAGSIHGLTIGTALLAPIPDEIAAHIDTTELSVEGRLVE